ncbi:hypothetical protein J6590_050094 [Homalodisca vitripennis]|nr:hypothetical protein J6590_050094 [Homalodisca vitripennis]
MFNTVFFFTPKEQRYVNRIFQRYITTRQRRCDKHTTIGVVTLVGSLHYRYSAVSPFTSPSHLSPSQALSMRTMTAPRSHGSLSPTIASPQPPVQPARYIVNPINTRHPAET